MKSDEIEPVRFENGKVFETKSKTFDVINDENVVLSS